VPMVIVPMLPRLSMWQKALLPEFCHTSYRVPILRLIAKWPPFCSKTQKQCF
jgi:hypothetical protein